jgi:hypothetical protein
VTTRDVPDLIRGLRTAARTLELADMLEGPARADMFAAVQRDLTRLSAIMGAASAAADLQSRRPIGRAV